MDFEKNSIEGHNYIQDMDDRPLEAVQKETPGHPFFLYSLMDNILLSAYKIPNFILFC